MTTKTWDTTATMKLVNALNRSQKELGWEQNEIVSTFLAYLNDRGLMADAAEWIDLTVEVMTTQEPQFHEGSTEEWHADEEPGYNYDV